MVGLAALYYSYQTTTIYRSEVLCVPVADESSADLSAVAGGLGGLAALAGINLSGSSNRDEVIAFLTSRRLTFSFLRSNAIVDKILAAYGEGEENDDEDVQFAEAYRIFDEEIRKVHVERDTGFVRVIIEWEDRSESALWANRLIDQLNRAMRERAISEATKSLEFLQHEYENTSIVSIRRSIADLIQTQINRIMLAKVREEYALKVLDPAVEPTYDDYIWPDRPLIVVIGFLMGGFVGGGLGLLRIRISSEADNKK